jgi:GNAT superfamily N-acetyltransferase
MDGDTVLASTKIYDFDAVLDSRPVGVCGLGAVFTLPAHRGHGHATTLIERVLEQALAKGQRLSLLFSEIGIDYYARIGFTAVPSHDATFRVADPPQRGAPATLVRVGDDRDYEAMAAMGRVRGSPFRFHLDRDRGLVQYAIAKQRLRAGLTADGARELQFFVAEEGATAVAYVVLAVEGGVWTILECGDRDPTGARIGAMFQVLIAREPSQRPPTINGRLPPGLLPPQMTVVDRVTSNEIMMIRPLGGTRIDRALEEHEVLYWRNDLF